MSYRYGKLEIRIEKDAGNYDDRINILVSHNGQQFSGIGVYGKDELRQLKIAINKFLKEGGV